MTEVLRNDSLGRSPPPQRGQAQRGKKEKFFTYDSYRPHRPKAVHNRDRSFEQRLTHEQLHDEKSFCKKKFSSSSSSLGSRKKFFTKKIFHLHLLLCSDLTTKKVFHKKKFSSSFGRQAAEKVFHKKNFSSSSSSLLDVTTKKLFHKKKFLQKKNFIFIFFSRLTKKLFHKKNFSSSSSSLG